MSHTFNNNNSKRTPLWLQEIIENGDERGESYKLFDENCLFGSCIIRDTSVNLHYSFPKWNENGKGKRIAFFWDGPFLEAATGGGTTGAVASVLGEMEALVDNGFEIFLFYCFRGWSNPNLYPGRKFSIIFIKPDDFYENQTLIENLVEFYDISFCQIDSAEAVNWLAPFVKNHCKIVFEVHNVQSTLMIQNFASKELIEYIKYLEKEAINMADLILLRSSTDMEEMKKLSDKHSHMKLYRGCISLDNVNPTPIKKKSSGNIVFMGHLNYEPNIQVLDIISTQIAPFISGKCFIVGLCSQTLQKKYAAKNMIFLNWVEDLNEVFAKVDIALAPITSGSGTAMKVLDYMAYHLPVIATSVAIRGLENEIEKAIIIENDISKYPSIINRLLTEPEELKRLAKLGCSFVRKHRDWKVGISDVIKAYSSLMVEDFHIWTSLEGMPRAGKTTTFNLMKQEYSIDTTNFEEIFFSPEHLKNRKDMEGTINESIWFLDQEAKRVETFSILKQKTPIILTDRCYLSTLAYTYALSMVKNTPEEFEILAEYFFANQKNYPNYKVIFVFDTDPFTTFGRREEKYAPHNVMWMNEKFMMNYRKFYQYELSKYTDAKLIHLNCNITLKSIWRIVYQTMNNLIHPTFSVVLCSHNDQSGLQTSLQSLSKQTIGTEKFEIIVVDNGSSPPLNIDFISSKSPMIIRTIYENRLGLSIARNTGISLARSNLIAITDPENIPNFHWLNELFETFKKFPDIMLIGGKLNNVIDGALPWYFPDQLLEYFTPPQWPKKIEILAYPYFATGANMAFRKIAFEYVGGFNKRLGRSGKRLLSCEDLEFKIKVQEAYNCNKCVLQPTAIISHVTNSSMFYFKKLILRAFWQGVSEVRMLNGRENTYNNRSFGVMLSNMKRLLFNMITFNAKESVYNIFIIILIFGYFYAIVSNIIHKSFKSKTCNKKLCRL